MSDKDRIHHTGSETELTQYGEPKVDVEQIEAMLVHDPRNEGLLDIAAFTYYSSGQLEKALMAYQLLVEIDHGNPIYHYCLGNTYYRLNRVAEAYQAWHMTIRVDSETGRYARRARKRLELVGSGGGVR